MPVDFSALGIAVAGLSANQRGLEVTGHNISNVSTKGYVRQRVLYETANSRSVQNMQIGTGVNVQGIEQIRNEYLDTMFRNENSNLGYWETRFKAIEDLEAIMAEPMKAGLQTALNNFWDSWQELSKNPESLTTRALVYSRGDTLVDQFNHLGQQITNIQDDLNEELVARIDEINDITKQIAYLNQEISKAEVALNSPNDYRDQRNLLLDKLSKLVDVETTEKWDGQIQVTAGGYLIVDRNQQEILYPYRTTSSSFYEPRIEGVNAEFDPGRGVLKGLMEARGMVSNHSGSIENGTPETRADICFAFDTSLAGANDYIAKFQANVANYLNRMDTEYLDLNYKVITYDGSGVTGVNEYTTRASFETGVAGLSAGGVAGADFGSVVSEISSTVNMSWRDESNRYMMVFTDESIDGDGVAVTDTTLDFYNGVLGLHDVEVSVVTDPSLFNDGIPSGTESGWNYLVDKKEGRFYDSTTIAADFDDLMLKIGEEYVYDINENITTPKEITNIISSVKARLNALCNMICREINKLHNSGNDLNGNPGQDFFLRGTTTLPFMMGNVVLNPNLEDYVKLVTSVSGENGDNTIAVAIANLRNSDVMNAKDDVMSIDGYYNDIIVDVGQTGYEANQIAENQKKLVEGADEYRQMVMGVSADEEMSNMMKFKYAYNANAKVVTVMTEMMNTLVNRVGRVGL